jgi:hypothetical protein
MSQNELEENDDKGEEMDELLIPDEYLIEQSNNIQHFRLSAFKPDFS